MPVDPAHAEPPDPLLGKVLDERYRIEEPLGQGGIGRVYKARHLILGRHVALKVLLAQYESIPVLQERFRREAEALAALSHPNIVTVTDFGVAEGMPYLVMELLEGEDLASLIEREIIDPARGFAIVRQVLRALAYAHSRELVHRDLKPQNIYVRALGDGTDHVEVLDFGLARFMGDAPNRGPKLTRAGALIGTPAYMAPEQASGEAVDARADVYAAGIVLFETLAGRKPFEARDPGEMLRSHLLVSPPRIAQVDPGLMVSEKLEALVARALAKSPADRFPGAAQMLAALDALGADAAKRIGERPPRDQPFRAVDATQGGVMATRAATPGAVRARGSIDPAPDTSIHLPKSRAPLLAIIGCAAGVLVGGAIAITVLFSDVLFADEAEPTPTTRVEESTSSVPTPAPPAPSPELPPRPAARDPFAEPVPDDLRSYLIRVRAGRELGTREYGVLSRWDPAHPGDVRGRLLLAHAYMNARSLSYALPLYQDLLRDQSLRGDERILEDLIELARANEARFNAPAADLIVTVYGSEALEALDDARDGITRRDRLGQEERARLEAIRNRIVTSGP